MLMPIRRKRCWRKCHTSDSELPEVDPGIDGVVDVLGDAQQRPHPALQQLQQSILALHIGGLVQGVKHAPQHEVAQTYSHRPGVGPPRPAPPQFS